MKMDRIAAEAERIARRGGAPVGYLSALPGVEAGAVRCLRALLDETDGAGGTDETDGAGGSGDARERTAGEFTRALGPERGWDAMIAFEEICDLLRRHGRRPLMRHRADCECLGADESAFATFIAAAADGDREDAVLIATLLVRADMAFRLTALAERVGPALARLSPRRKRAAPRWAGGPRTPPRNLH